MKPEEALEILDELREGVQLNGKQHDKIREALDMFREILSNLNHQQKEE